MLPLPRAPYTPGNQQQSVAPTSPTGRRGSVAQIFYRRPLPDSCIAFASDEGKAIFKEALETGHMNCYFRLASQFRTQDEPAYCGLSTLIMVLNALEIDPGRVWKGLPRGFIQVWSAKDTKSLLLFKIAEQFSVNASPQGLQDYEGFVSAWNKELMAVVPTAEPSTLTATVRQAVQGLIKVACVFDHQMVVLRTQEHISCTHGCNLQCIVKQLLVDLQETKMFGTVCDQVDGMSGYSLDQLANLFGLWPSTEGRLAVGVEVKAGEEEGRKRCCDMKQYLCLCHFLTAFFLSWPYAPTLPPSSLGSALERWSLDILQGSRSQLLRDEMTTLHRQLKKITGFHSPGSLSPEKESPPVFSDVQETSRVLPEKIKPATGTGCCSEKKEQVKVSGVSD